MNKEAKKLWIEGLTSGDYLQSAAQLCNTNGFCCLGVLTDIFILIHQDYNWLKNITTGREYNKKEFYVGLVQLPEIVARWAGLASRDPIMHFNGSNLELSLINDDARADFQEIANLINEQL